VNVSTALDAGAPVEDVFIGPDAPPALVERAIGMGANVHQLPAGVLERVSDTVTPQPVVAVVSFVDRPLEEVQQASFVIVCAGVADPGNLGTVIRSAESAGAEAVICAEGSVDMYNPKTVRASAGSMFYVPLVVGGDPVTIVRQLGGWGITTVAATAHGGDEPGTVDFGARVALVFGNETSGVPSAVERATDRRVTIPLRGRSESLNVGMAAAILGFEVARQRRGAAW
jgi:TrmH family RNA methyltransferase